MKQNPCCGCLAASLLAILTLAPLHEAQANPVRIMPMGDSITEGYDGAAGFTGLGGYRDELYNQLVTAGYSIDFVGTATTNSSLMTDMNHQGIGGWRIDQLDANVAAWFDAISGPDIILLHIGTNDFGQGFDTVNAINRLDALITKMAGLRPDAHIIVTNLMERGEPQNTAIQTQFNPFVVGVVNAQIAAGNLVSFLDMRALVPITDMPDNLHPNQTGYDKMATGWFGAIDALLDPGDGVAPAMIRVRSAGARDQVIINFNKSLDQTTAETSTNYVLDMGVNVLSATLSGCGRIVTLTTDKQSPGVTLTLTVNGVQDEVMPTPNMIAVNSTAQFTTVTPRGYFNNVPESGAYSLVYSLDIPNTANYAVGAVPYNLDYRSRIGAYDRIAYYLERQTATGVLEYAWASMDAFSTNPDEIGVPSVAAGVTWQTGVTNLNVVSNVPGVMVGEGFAGNIEFWPSDYDEVNTANVPGASGSTFDFGDGNFSTSAGYGSMQVHNTDGAQTVIAFNRWGDSTANTDVGIGNNPAPVTSGIDWTSSQSGPGLTIKTLQVLVRDLSPPELTLARCNLAGTGITVRFNEPVRSDSLLATHFSLDNGVEVLGAVVGSDSMSVFLETSSQPAGVALTLTAANVRDITSSANVMVPGGPGTSIPVTGVPAEVAANIGAASDGYKLLYSVDIPVVGNFNATTPYVYDDSAVPGGFSRVAYYLETQVAGGPVQYVWAAMDAFTADKSKVGVPTFASGAVFQQSVTNLDVVSNVAGIVNGTGLSTGNIEFWPHDYLEGNAAGVTGASGTAYDFGDERLAGGDYGSMQVHNHGASQTLFALNQWGSDGLDLDVGIGNAAATHTDWTFSSNAGSYTRRVLHVMILPSTPTIPAEVLANVPESADYELVYSLEIPDVGDFNATNPYTVDESTKPGGFTRVAYYLELQVGAGPVEYVWASMDPFTGDKSKIGIPTFASGAVFQQPVTNLNVVSNVAGIINGTGLSTGNIEFWPHDYLEGNAAGVTGASGTLYDFGDERLAGGNYGSMQVHNHGASQTLFAMNRFGADGNALCLGIGNSSGAHPDWTLANNAGTYSRKVLHVLTKPGSSPVGELQIVDVVGSTTLDRLVVTFDEEVSDPSATPGNFTIDGGLTVTGASLLAGNRAIALTTSVQTAGQLYTVTVSGVRERAPLGTFIEAGATAQFTAYSPPAMLTNVPDAGMELIYCLDIPAATPAWNDNRIPYSVNEAQFGEFLFDRVAYLLELDGDWAYVSFDPHTNQLAQIGIPTLGVTATAFQSIVTDMNVASNVGGIVTGNGIATGNIEFWGGNYQQANAIGIPGASVSLHDFGDTMSAGGRGSLQVHNHGAGALQTILAYNNWGSNTGGTSEVGIGNNAGAGDPDWTSSGSASTHTTRRIYVLAHPGGVPSGDPPLIIAHPSSRTVLAGTGVIFAVSVSGNGPFSYQWRRDGIPLPGATSALLDLGAVSPSDEASYDVVVTGPNFVSATSFPAQLTVTSFIAAWRTANGFHPSGIGPDEGHNDDKDFDLRENLLEAASGTDPNVADLGRLSIDAEAGTFVAGDHIFTLESNPLAVKILYVRLVNHAAAGLTYSPEYSTGGALLEDPANPEATRVQIPDGEGGLMDLPVQNVNGFDYEVVEELLPLFDPSGMIGRVRVDLSP